MRRKYKSKDEENDFQEPFFTPKEYKPEKKRYVAVVGVSLDKFGKRFRPGDEIPLEYLEDPDVAFDWLLNKRKAIKEIRS